MMRPTALQFKQRDLNKLRELAKLYQGELQPTDSFDHRLDAEQTATKLWLVSTLALLEKLGYNLIQEGDDGPSN